MLVGNIFSIFDTNILGNLLLHRTHQIGSIQYAKDEDVALELLAETNLCTLGLQHVPRPMPTTLSTAVCQTTTIASSISPTSGKSSLCHSFNELVSSRLALILFLHQNPESPTTSKIKCWKKGVQDPPRCLTSIILTLAWILPPSYMDQLPGSINQLKVYCYDDFILEVSSGGKLEKYIFVRC